MRWITQRTLRKLPSSAILRDEAKRAGQSEEIPRGRPISEKDRGTTIREFSEWIKEKHMYPSRKNRNILGETYRNARNKYLTYVKRIKRPAKRSRWVIVVII